MNTTIKKGAKETKWRPSPYYGFVLSGSCNSVSALDTAILFTLCLNLPSPYSFLVFFAASKCRRCWIGEGKKKKDERCVFLSPALPPSCSCVLFAASKTCRRGWNACCGTEAWRAGGADGGIPGGPRRCVVQDDNANNSHRCGAVSLLRPAEVTTMVTAEEQQQPQQCWVWVSMVACIAAPDRPR